jgi:hypothetical protein
VPSVAVICSPNMGIVDSWLPVVAAVRETHPDWRLVAIVPRGWGVGIRPDAAAVRALDGLVDAAVVEVLPGEYRWVADLREADPIAARLARAGAWLQDLEGRASRRGIGFVRMLRRIIRVGALLAPGGVRRRWPSRETWSAVLIDADVVNRVEVRELLRALGDPPSLSLSHGLGYRDPDADGPRAARTPVDLAYAYSEGHRLRLMQDHGLAAGNVRVTGIPRHDPEGPQLVAEPIVEPIASDWDDAVLLISRPATSHADRPSTPTDWFPAGRKAEQLRAIHRVVCEEQGLRLIVTMHPKERDDRAIEEGLPAAQRGRTWLLTETHPLALAPRLRFAVSFSSGVAVDLLSSGVPTIEFQDVRGASAFDGPEALRDSEGRVLRTSERCNALVLAADDEADLRGQVGRILVARDHVLATLQDAYRARYADPRGAVASIVRDLEAFAAGRVPTIGPSGVDH